MTRQDITGAAEPGTYHLTLVCVGTGAVRVSLGVIEGEQGPEFASDDVQCSGAGTALDLTYSTAVAIDLTVLVEGLPGADAAYAYRLWRT